MTLGVAWIRNTANVQEVVVASDSLLSAGPETWEACPKILPLPRTDAVISFAGVTEFAYPAMLQISRAIESHPAQVERRYDITYLAGLVEDVINQLDSFARTEAPDSLKQSRKVTEFLLSGFSWKYSSFRIWRFAWDPRYRRYTKRQCGAERGSDRQATFRFIGTHAAQGRAVSELRKIVAGRSSRKLDMEPYEVLAAIIESKEYRDIGGAPQVVKVYRHLNSQVFGTTWTIRGEEVETYAGRPLLEFEKLTIPLISRSDPGKFGKSVGRSRRAIERTLDADSYPEV